jgi:hypothetical protein
MNLLLRFRITESMLVPHQHVDASTRLDAESIHWYPEDDTRECGTRSEVRGYGDFATGAWKNKA